MGRSIFRAAAMLALAACSLAACVPGSGGVNSASAGIQQRCAPAAVAAAEQRVDLVASLAAPALVAIGVPQAKIDLILAGIRRGELTVDASCAIIEIVAAPPGGAAVGGGNVQVDAT